MQPINTFIVEDSPIILTNLVATLEELAPVKVVGSAPDESGALRWLTEPANHCDLVIIDVVLKSGSGLGVLKGSTRSELAAKRVVLTNYATTDMRRGMNTLALMVQETLRHDPHGGDLYVFRGKSGKLIKVLWHDGRTHPLAAALWIC